MMSGLRRVVGVVCAALAVSCAGPTPGWQRLWAAEWQHHDRGLVWALGLPASGREVEITGRDVELRCELFNTGDRPATVRLSGADRVDDWSLGAGESRPVAVSLQPGTWRFEAPPEVILGSPRIGRPLPDARLLVVILVDTLRADHVTPELMPGVNGFFADGRRWTAAVANAPWTLPSVASLFAGRPVLDLTSPEGEVIGLPEGMPSWASVLHEAGFEGCAVVANATIHTLNGFAAGFSTFLVPDGKRLDSSPDAGWVVDRARRWLDAHDGENAFLYLHLMDPHEPYRDHDGRGLVAPALRPLARRQRLAGADEATILRELYAGEVRHTDRALAPLLGDLPPHAAVVFTADHGEALGEHGAWAHGLNLYREATDVPLMIRAPGVETGKVGEPVQLLDLAPTVLDLVGVEPDAGMAGRSLLAAGPPAPIVSVTFSAGPLRWSWRDGSRKIVLRMAAQPDLGAQNRRQPVEADPLPSGAFAFDLAADPTEDRPLEPADERMPEVGAVFAATAGRLVPGLQLLIWSDNAQSGAGLGFDGEVEIVQAWSAGRIETVRRPGRLVVRCADPGPVCAVAFAGSSIPERVTPLAGGAEWLGVAPGVPVDPGRLAPLERIEPGAHLWWNPDRPLVVGGYDETVERLRALGYIE